MLDAYNIIPSLTFNLFHLSQKIRICISSVKEVRKPCSFDDLKGNFNNFEEACLRRGLIGSDGEYIACLQTMGLSPKEARKFVIMLLMTNDIISPSTFVTDVFDYLSQDLEQQFFARYNLPLESNQNLAPDLAKRSYLLYLFSEYNFEVDLVALGFHISDIELLQNFNLPDVADASSDFDTTDIINYFRTSLSSQEDIDADVDRLTPAQKCHFDTIVNAVVNSNDSALANTNNNLYFLDAPAGSGKTFLTKSIIKFLRSHHNKVVLNVVSTGIAASLMEKGFTSHKMFAIPIFQEYSCALQIPVACDPSKSQKKILKNADVIFWYKITITSSTVCCAVKSLMKEVKDSDELFGGCIVVFFGDFRQCLPVVINAVVK